MSTTSQKHRIFVNEPMGDKPVTALPGIGKVLGERLEKKGINKASTVLGYYLKVERDPERFTEWLRSFGANDGQIGTCINALMEWTNNNL